MTMKVFISGIVGLVVAAVILSFFLVGSPQQERARRYDQVRRDAISNLQYQILEYYRVNETLPQTLDELITAHMYVNMPLDPVSAEPFGYEAIGQQSFMLCATFNAAYDNTFPAYPRSTIGPYVVDDSLNHPAGYHCFERVIEVGTTTTADVAVPPELRPL